MVREKLFPNSLYMEKFLPDGLDETQTVENLSFNMWLTPTMMFVVKRACNSVVNLNDSQAIIDINTLGFVGTLAVKN